MKIEIIEIDSDRNSSVSYEVRVNGKTINDCVGTLQEARKICKTIAPKTKPIERLLN